MLHDVVGEGVSPHTGVVKPGSLKTDASVDGNGNNAELGPSRHNVGSEAGVAANSRDGRTGSGVAGDG